MSFFIAEFGAGTQSMSAVSMTFRKLPLRSAISLPSHLQKSELGRITRHTSCPLIR